LDLRKNQRTARETPTGSLLGKATTPGKKYEGKKGGPLTALTSMENENEGKKAQGFQGGRRSKRGEYKNHDENLEQEETREFWGGGR